MQHLRWGGLFDLPDGVRDAYLDDPSVEELIAASRGYKNRRGLRKTLDLSQDQDILDQRRGVVDKWGEIRPSSCLTPHFRDPVVRKKSRFNSVLLLASFASSMIGTFQIRTAFSYAVALFLLSELAAIVGGLGEA
jgi:hypothetical protein